MSSLHLRTSLLGLIVAFAACAGLPLTPVTSERRPVHPRVDSSKTLSLAHEMVFDDRSPPANELRLAAGVYSLEAMDDEYWYLRASVPLELKVFHKGGKLETRHLAGGIMLGKYAFRAVPAGAYIDGEDAAVRILVWKLPGDFLSRENRDWKRSF